MPDNPRVTAAYGRGVDFMTTLLGADGRLRADRDGPRYPLYSTSLGIIVLNVPKNDRHRATRDAMVAALRAMQRPDGGWGYSDDEPGNLSATVYAVGALFLAGVPPTDPAMVAARRFVEGCQNYGAADDDGGFFFGPAIPDSNKAGPLDGKPGRYRSYGSMTADGARALLRLGATPDHPRVRAAAAWLERNFEAGRNAGDFAPIAEVRRASAYYYWTWTAAHALRDLGLRQLHTPAGQVDWPVALAEALLARQRHDGSWANGNTEMREDDPVVATSFATAALAVCRVAMGGTFRSHAAPPL